MELLSDLTASIGPLRYTVTTYRELTQRMGPIGYNFGKYVGFRLQEFWNGYS